ncbi:MAG: Imm5 family immunity protein [Pseudomonadales bacterium]|nr:Imm5 family immunity protein [Pseudomonadales bacterium]
MSRTQSIKIAIQNARTSIEEREDHHLTLPLRKALWLSFGPIEKAEKSKAIRTEGYECRVELALNTCKKVLPVWNKFLAGSDIVDRALKGLEAYLNEEITFEDAKKLANTLMGGLQNGGENDDELRAMLVGYACVDLLYLAMYDAYCDDIDELDEELDEWDYSMYAAGVYSEGYPFLEGEYSSDPERLKEFWLDYLRDAETLI